MTAQQTEQLAIEVYAACFDRYDRHRQPFTPTIVTPRQAWAWLHKEQKEMCRDQARQAAAWLKAHPEALR